MLRLRRPRPPGGAGGGDGMTCGLGPAGGRGFGGGGTDFAVHGYEIRATLNSRRHFAQRAPVHHFPLISPKPRWAAGWFHQTGQSGREAEHLAGVIHPKRRPPDQGGRSGGLAIGSGWPIGCRHGRTWGRTGTAVVSSKEMVGRAPKGLLKRGQEFAQTLATPARGSRISKQAPPSAPLRAVTAPPWATATARTIERPRPVPVPLRELRSAGPWPRTKRSKT